MKTISVPELEQKCLSFESENVPLMSEQDSRDRNICPELTFPRIRSLIKMGIRKTWYHQMSRPIKSLNGKYRKVPLTFPLPATVVPVALWRAETEATEKACWGKSWVQNSGLFQTCPWQNYHWLQWKLYPNMGLLVWVTNFIIKG